MLGNIGGYIGLFLGYSLLHLPHFLLSLWNTGYKNRKKQKNKLLLEEDREKKANEFNQSVLTSDNLCLSCTKLKDINDQVLTIARSLSDLESSVHQIRENLKDSRTTPSNNKLRRVRVTEWDNSLHKIHCHEQDK